MQPSFWKVLLAPFSALYGLGLLIWHDLYDTHILPAKEVPVPTIGVGNLAVGGTGKTPHVEYLIRLLSPNYHVAVASLGYGRITRDVHIVQEDDTARTVGDELMQMHRKFPHIPMVACKNRVKGIKALLARYPDTDVVILDDAYQYHHLKCGLNMILTAADNLYTDDHLLPWGTLRDLPLRSHKADAIIVTKCSAEMQPIDYRVLKNKLSVPTFQKLFFSRMTYPELKSSCQHPILITGIANPAPLHQHLVAQYPTLQWLSFMDHHRFNNMDIQRILRLSQTCDTIFTTEKDFERLRMVESLQPLLDRIVVVPIEVTMGEDQPDFARFITNYVSESLRTLKK